MRYGKTRGAGPLAGTSDIELARRAADGDRPAFAELVERAAPAAHSLLRRMGAQPALADDLTQDTLVTALRAMATYRGEAPFAAWTMRIAAREYLQYLRRNRRLLLSAEPLDLEAADERETPHGERIDLDAALQRLSAPERLCVSLCHGAGLTHDELAAALQIPLGTAKSHVTRGLEKLRRWLVDEPADVPMEKHR